MQQGEETEIVAAHVTITDFFLQRRATTCRWRPTPVCILQTKLELVARIPRKAMVPMQVK